jgi:hypothetical protein
VSLRYFFFIFSCLFIQARIVTAQEVFNVTGTITDSVTREPLPGASVLVTGTGTGTQTDAQGHFSLPLRKGDFTLRISFIGYRPLDLKIQVTKDLNVSISLPPAVTTAGNVIVSAKNPSSNTESARTGMVELTGKEIRKLPALMGETDVIRALNYSPGVQNAGDGNSGFYVRGGNVDQNLILLDNAMVYNPSHVLGFFSVFNSDIISNATLIKSGIPANFGGRLSSVLAIRTIDGNFEKHTASLNLGMLFSTASVQGPLIRNKLSYFISFRKTYVNLVAQPLIRNFAGKDSTNALKSTNYDMYDLNAKISWKPSPRDKASLLFYKGRDNFHMQNPNIGYSNLINWGNTLLAFNWNHQLTDSAYILNSLSYSKYDYNFGSSQFILSLDLYSSVRNINYRFEYNRSGFWGGNMKTGLEARYYRFIPNKFLLTINNAELDYGSYQDLYATEISGYASWDKNLGDKLKMNAGLRLTNYNHLGPYDMVSEASGEGLKDTVSYDKGRIVKSYTYPEPRLSFRYQTGHNTSLKASYTRNYQYIHVVSSSSVTLPSDIWIPSTKEIKPQSGDQFTLGAYHNFRDNLFSGSVEVYYKNLRNQVEMLYGLGASFQETSFENSLAYGKGYSAGIEFFLQKNAGNLTGSVSYAYAHSQRQFDEINHGLWFPAKYDRRHEINAVANYHVRDRWDFSMAFTYASGNAMTIPEQKYFIEGSILNEYGPVNSFRMPAYHRLDLSVTWHFKPRHLLESSLNFSVFNVYNRANPFLIYFDIKGDIAHYNLTVTARQISIFPIMPSLSWNIKI